MRLDTIPFDTTDWEQPPAEDHPGITGVARWRTRQCGDIRVRMVEYSPAYLANHWCDTGTSVSASTGYFTPNWPTAGPSC